LVSFIAAVLLPPQQLGSRLARCLDYPVTDAAADAPKEARQLSQILVGPTAREPQSAIAKQRGSFVAAAVAAVVLPLVVESVVVSRSKDSLGPGAIAFALAAKNHWDCLGVIELAEYVSVAVLAAASG